MSKPRSRKSKGRAAEQEIVDLLKAKFNLTDEDIRKSASSVTGEDIILSNKAREIFPYQIEVKRRAKLAIYSFIDQCCNHGDHTPIVFMRQDRGKWLVMMYADDFLGGLK